MHAPAVVALGDMADAELGEDLSSVGLGVGQIGHGYGVLGADIAARTAIAAERASGLSDAGRIDHVLEAHDDRRRHRGDVESLARPFERAVLRQRSGIAVSLRPQHRGGAVEAEIEQAVATHVPGPGGIGEDTRIGSQRNAGIDKGAAAEPATDKDMNVSAEPEIEQSRGRAGMERCPVQLKLAAELGKAARELAGEELLALLDDADALARTRKP